LSHEERRRLHAVLTSRRESERRRGRRLKRTGIVLGGAIAAMVIAGAAFGVVPAIDASLGGGVTGSFTVQQDVCAHGNRGEPATCTWMGIFRPGDGSVARELDYGGIMPAGDGPGSVIQARYPGGPAAYALHGSHTWVPDLVITLVISAAVGFLLWVSPLGSGDSKPEDARA
jgi:hypothetical protein